MSSIILPQLALRTDFRHTRNQDTPHNYKLSDQVRWNFHHGIMKFKSSSLSISDLINGFARKNAKQHFRSHFIFYPILDPVLK